LSRRVLRNDHEVKAVGKSRGSLGRKIDVTVDGLDNPVRLKGSNEIG